MENEKYNEIETIVKALDTELKPLFEEVKALNEVMGEVRGEFKQHPLPQLISRLTKTARRHLIEKKVVVMEEEVKVGTNHQGLGIEYNHASQLTPIVDEGHYSNHENDEQVVRDILFDSDAVIDLTSIIKKQNQKRFLKIMKILGKYKIDKAFNNFKNDNIQDIKVDGTNGTEISIRFTRYSIDFIINKEGENWESHFIANYGVISDKPTIKPYGEEDNPILKQISPKRSEESISNIKNGIFISQNKKAIAEAMKSKRTLLTNTLKTYKKETDELNDLLNPLLALEKL